MGNPVKAFGVSRMLIGVFAVASVTMFAQSDNWQDERFRAKYGRHSPPVEARLKAEQASQAYRLAPTSGMADQASYWREQYFKAKHGRNSPIEEARLKIEQENTAFRADTTRAVAPAESWVDQRHKSKYGRTLGR